jgi:hypothetical protein
MSALAPALVSLALVSPAWADEAAPVAPESKTRFHADVEVDPTAYVLDGYSVHAGFGWNRVRVDLGAFAMHMPEAVHKQHDFNVGFDGFGLKLQYFLFTEQSGFFFGVDSGVARALVQLKNSQLAELDRQLTVGVNLGYRIDIAEGFYATPWIGFSRAFGADDITLGDKTYDNNPWLVFPAVHIGYRMR